jgi:Na+/proline symporter
MAGYVVVVIQTVFAPRMIIPLAYDSGGVTTSTVTVPLVAALGLGLASNVPGRSPIMDGFGLIAFASVFPIISVLGYAQLAQLIVRRRNRKQKKAKPGHNSKASIRKQSGEK